MSKFFALGDFLTTQWMGPMRAVFWKVVAKWWRGRLGGERRKSEVVRNFRGQSIEA